jgi:hypothetical protein
LSGSGTQLGADLGMYQDKYQRALEKRRTDDEVFETVEVGLSVLKTAVSKVGLAKHNS